MTEDDVIRKTKGAYLCLIHPISNGDDACRQEISSVIAIAHSVPDEVITSMITGASWRERLLGLCMAMAKRPEMFIEPMVQSLRDPRGVSIIPTCAALAILARRGIFVMPRSFGEMFDRNGFDGELGWAIDKALYFAGLSSDDAARSRPHHGKAFDEQIEFYSEIHASG